MMISRAAMEPWPARLDRVAALDRLIPDPDQFFFIGSLGLAAQDASRLTSGGARAFALGGAMGAAVPMALGLALARPEHTVVALVGDGELLMSVGSLATAAVQRPANLAVVCLDNGRYLETGAQVTHTSFRTDLESMAAGAGIPVTRTVTTPDEADEAALLLKDIRDTTFIRLVIRADSVPSTKYEMDGAVSRVRFRSALQPAAD